MKIIHNLQFFLYDDNRFVQNKFIISMISIYKSILLVRIKYYRKTIYFILGFSGYQNRN